MSKTNQDKFSAIRRRAIEIMDKGWVHWPMCPIKGCQNRICLRLESSYCYPHTGSGKTLDELLDELNREPERV